MTERNSVDMVLLNGNIVTVDPNNTLAEAVSVKDGRIIQVGSNREIEALLDKKTEIIDLEEKTLLPGFIDAHAHLASTAVSLTHMVSIHSPPIKSFYEILEKIREKAQQTPRGEWVIGRGCFIQPQKLVERRYPTRYELDEVVPDHPVVLMAGAHLNMLNSRALKLSGITKDSPQPPHGHIYRDSVTGEPTGLVSELFHTLPIPKWNYEQMKKAVKTVSQTLFIQQGVTTIHEIPYSTESIRIYQELISQNELQLRIRVYPVVPRQIELDWLIGLGLRSGFGNEQLKLGGVKIFVDGGTSGRGAAMHEPYSNDPENYGSLALSQEKLTELVTLAHNAGFQLCIHACGDRGQDIALKTIEDALNEKPKKDHRHRIEHAGNYFATAERINRMKDLGVIPAPNPQMLNSLGDFLKDHFGDRAQNVFSLKSLLNVGIKFPITSDSTGTQPEAANPLWGIWCAVARETYNGKKLCPEEGVTIMDAISMYTINAAYAGFEEDIKGSIEAGKLADMIVLSDNILKVPVDKIRDIEVEMTIIDGKIVYEKPHARG